MVLKFRPGGLDNHILLFSKKKYGLLYNIAQVHVRNILHVLKYFLLLI